MTQELIDQILTAGIHGAIFTMVMGIIGLPFFLWLGNKADKDDLLGPALLCLFLSFCAGLFILSGVYELYQIKNFPLVYLDNRKSEKMKRVEIITEDQNDN